MKYKYILLLLLALSCSLDKLVAQEVDSIAVANAQPDVPGKQKKENWFNRAYPNPKRAALFSLIIPGAGQLYNKRWWKAPLVYGALAGMALVVDYNQSRYRRLRNALDLARRGETHEFTGTRLDNISTLRTLRDSYDKNTQMAYFGMVLVYTLQAMEAFVDAHLKGFDIDDDLSLQLKPQLDFVAPLGQPVMGFGLTVPLNGRAPEKPGRNLAGR